MVGLEVHHFEFIRLTVDHGQLTTDKRTKLIMTLNLSDGGKRNLVDLSIWTKHLDARRCEGLRCFHAADSAPYASTVGGDDFDVVFPV